MSALSKRYGVGLIAIFGLFFLSLSAFWFFGGKPFENSEARGSSIPESTAPVWQLPPNVKIINSPLGWDGKIEPPTFQDTAGIKIPIAHDGTATVFAVLDIGSMQYTLSLNKPVRLLIPKQAGKSAGYFLDDDFFNITTTCDEDNQEAVDIQLEANEECKMNVNSDLIIWTKHFNRFVIFEETKLSEAPLNLSIIINNGEQKTNDQKIKVILKAVDSSPDLYYRLSNTNYFNDQPWEKLITSVVDWKLDDESGIRTVYAQFRDGNYNISSVISDSIKYEEKEKILDKTDISFELYGEQAEVIKEMEKNTVGVLDGVIDEVYQPGDLMSFAYKTINPLAKNLTVFIKRQIQNNYTANIYTSAVEAKDIKVDNFFTLAVSSLPTALSKQRMLSVENYTVGCGLIKFDKNELSEIVNKNLPYIFNLSFSYENPTDELDNQIKISKEIIREGNGEMVYKSTKNIIFNSIQVKQEAIIKELPKNQTTGRYVARVKLQDIKTGKILAEESVWFNIELE